MFWVIRLKKMRACGVCVVEKKNMYRIFMRKPDGKRPHGRPRPRWDDSVKVYLEEKGCEVADGLICLRLRTSGRLLQTW
jgi:hypothetical protein